MKQEPELYWCLFHSSLNTKLKVITSNWLNFKLVFQEPQEFQMRAREPSLLIYSVSEHTLISLIFQETVDKTHVRMDDFMTSWHHQAEGKQELLKGRGYGAVGRKTEEIWSLWVRNYFKQFGQVTELIVFLPHVCPLWLTVWISGYLGNGTMIN